MATLTNTKIKDTYKSLLKVSDNGNLEAGLQEITDGEGNASGVQLNTSGDLTASGTVAFGSLKDSGENITITKLVDEADGIASNDNDTTIPTSAAVKDYVDAKVTAEDLDFAGDSGTGAVDLDSQTLTIEGTANEVVTSASGQTLTIGLPSTINVDVQGALTGNVTGNVSGNVTGNVTGNVSGDLTGNVTATSVLANGVVATTQASSDNSTKVATTAFVKSVVTAEDLDFGGDSGTGSVDLDSQTLTIAGTANEIVTSAAGQTLTVGLPSSITVDVVGNLTGNVSGNVTGDVTGNADTATALETSRTIALSGDVVASGSFDGSANLTLSATIQPNSVALGTDTTGDYVSNLGAGTGVTIASNTGEGSNPTITVNYGSTANTSVEGDTALTIQGTTNEIEVSGGAVTLGSGGTVTVGLPDNVIIAGDLTVNGTTTTINTQTLSVEDPLIELANQNASNSVDTGFFANYSLDAGVTTKYAGLFKDSSDSDKFKLFKGLEVEPATTVDVAGTGYTKGDLVVNDLDAVTISGTLSTAAQTNITSVGTLSSLAVSGNLTVDTNTLFVDAANNAVGVGTSSPAGKLSVLLGETNLSSASAAATTGYPLSIRFTGTASDANLIRHEASANPTGYYTLMGTRYDNNKSFVINNKGSEIITYSDITSNGLGLSGGAGNLIRFDTAGSERMRIDSSGNVGIGTVTPDNISSTGTILSISKSGGLTTNDILGSLTFITADPSYTVTYADGVTAEISSITESATGAAYGLAFSTGTVSGSDRAERMRINNSGNVIVGSTTANNGDAVTLRQDGTAHVNNVQLANAAGSAGGTTPSIYSPAGGEFAISLNSAERLRIDGSGNVDVNGGGYLRVSPSTPPSIQIFRNANLGNNASAGSLNFGGKDTSDFATGASISTITTGVWSPTSHPTVLLFSTTASGASTTTERMRIASGGDVLFGTTSAGQSNSNSVVLRNFNSTSGPNGIQISHLNGTNSGVQYLYFVYNGLAIGSITQNGTSAVAYNTSSDYRLKENVVPMEGALDRVSQLQPSRFNFIADPETTVDGFLAHQVQEVVPEAITGQKDEVEEYEITPAVLDDEGNVIEEAVMGTRPIYQGIDQSKLVPLLVGAIQELKAEIETLKSQING
jgi:hypothetical protein